MLNIALDLEQAAKHFSPIILVVPGIVCVLAGLFVWLGGLGWRKPVAAIIGALAGGFGVYIYADQKVVLTTVSAGTAAVLAMLFEKVCITIIATVTAAVVAFVFLAGPSFEPPAEISHTNLSNGKVMTVPQTLENIRVRVNDLTKQARELSTSLTPKSQAIIAGSAVVVLLAGFFFWNFTCALFCSAVGTSLIFAGMVSLLFYKQSGPVTAIAAKGSFYTAIFASMVAFGSLEQLMLCRAAKKKAKKAEKEQTGTRKKTWRKN